MKKKLQLVITVLILFSILSLSTIIKAVENNSYTNSKDIIEKQDINKIYYAKIDSKEEYYKKLEENNIKVEIKKQNFSKIYLEKTINTTIQIELSKLNEKQNTKTKKEENTNITKNNIKDNIQNIKLDLYMHINKELLEEMKTIKIYKNENNKKELLSETPFLIINKTQLPLNLTIELELKPINTEEYCEEKTIKDIIPKEAYNINIPKEITLNETIGKECTLILKHKAIKEFKQIILPKKYENYNIKKTEPKINIKIE